jgi:hypothetical protein
MAGKGGTAAAVKQLEVLLREHRWAQVLEMRSRPAICRRSSASSPTVSLPTRPTLVG